jgi:hypothetical protein
MYVHRTMLLIIVLEYAFCTYTKDVYSKTMHVTLAAASHISCTASPNGIIFSLLDLVSYILFIMALGARAHTHRHTDTQTHTDIPVCLIGFTI